MKVIYTIYATIVAGFLFILTLLLTLALKPFLKIEKILDFIKFMFQVILKLIFIRVEVVYEEEIDKNKTYIFMPNHVSMMDVLLMAAYRPVYMNAIEAASHFKWFLYGKVIKMIGQIPIERHNVESSIKSFEIAKERLKTGRSIIVFPEGTRSRTGELGKFKNMPFRFALDAKTDIVPVALVGVEKISPEKSKWIRPVKVKIVFGKHFKASEFETWTFDELRDKVREKIEAMLKEYK